jgi:6-phosphofructokinase 2
MATIVTVTLNPCVDKTFTVERVIANRKLSGTEVRCYPGGGGINVARAVIALGGRACALWSRGGPIGAQLQGLLDDEGVPHAPVTIAGAIRENLIVDERDSDDQYRFGMPGPSLDDEDLERWRSVIAAQTREPGYLVVSGSLPPNVSADWLAETIRALPAHTRVIIDSKQPALARALDVGVFLIKPNINELQALAGRELVDDDAIVAAGRDIVAGGGTQAVLISLGGGGALFIDNDSADHIPAPSVPRRSRVGAGDSMIGGMVCRLAAGDDASVAACYAVAAGTASVMTPGTELCRRDDTDRLYQQICRRVARP